jgi:hypothetical protein
MGKPGWFHRNLLKWGSSCFSGFGVERHLQQVQAFLSFPRMGSTPIVFLLDGL